MILLTNMEKQKDNILILTDIYYTLMEQKGLEIEKSPKKYTLFDDAAESE